MKRFIFLLVALMPVLVFAQKAKIDFTTTSHNFGTINENAGKATFDFSFKNTGNVPLILTNVRAGCGCTTPVWSREPVAPGQTGSIKVAFDPRNRPGAFVKSITVNSNASNSVVSLTIRGNVTRKPLGPYDQYKFNIGALKLTSNTINLGAINNNQVLERKIEVINSENKPARLQVISEHPHLTVSVSPTTLTKDQKATISIKYDATKKNDWGFVTDKIQLQVNDKTTGDITVAATISEDFSHYNGNFEKAPAISLSETEYTLNDLDKNSTYTHEFPIQTIGKSELVIRKIKTSDSNLSVTASRDTVKPGKKIKVNLSVKTGNAQKLIKIIQFTTNDPHNPIMTYKLIGNLK